ncbi:MAG TPA: hypothetical protein VJY36_06465 [Candidatus Bathyarchaeia archaeon]|nr:hypothetical protein [Candidatus Bathyarchaeia archaeon]
METPRFKLADIFTGIMIPLILVFLIYFLAIYINPNGASHVIGKSSTIGIILTQGFAQMIILGIPMILGLLWNKWAGGAAGFITGGMYYLAEAGYSNGSYAVYSSFANNFYGDLSMLSYLVMAVIIGYMAGSLSNGSMNFKRLLGAGMTAAVITASIQAYFNYTVSLAPARLMNHQMWSSTAYLVPGLYGFVLQFIPSIALGAIIPILAKVMSWYGLQPVRHQ